LTDGVDGLEAALGAEWTDLAAYLLLEPACVDTDPDCITCDWTTDTTCDAPSCDLTGYTVGNIPDTCTAQGFQVFMEGFKA